jgi:hypothetical protein
MIRQCVLITFAVLVPVTAAAQTKIITRCTGIEGQGYYVEGGLVPKQKAGWQKDDISRGSYLVTKIGDDYDIIYVDAADRTVSTREDGGQVLTVTDMPGTIVLLVVYPRISTETWTLRLDDQGRGFVMQTISRFNSPIKIEKYSLMRATCSR